MSGVVVINDLEFESEVLKSEKPVVAYFWASWCGPCKLVSPTVEGVAKEYSDRLKVVKLEVDPNPEAVAHCKVEGVPALRLFKEGEITASHEGAIGKQALLAWLDRNLS